MVEIQEYVHHIGRDRTGWELGNLRHPFYNERHEDIAYDLVRILLETCARNPRLP